MGAKVDKEILTPIFARTNGAGQTALLRRSIVFAILGGGFVLNMLYGFNFGRHGGRLCLIDAGLVASHIAGAGIDFAGQHVLLHKFALKLRGNFEDVWSMI